MKYFSAPSLDDLSLPGPKDIIRHEFDNGIVVLIRENHVSPSVVVSGYFGAGALDESPEQAGLAAFTAAMLMRGTQKRSFAQIYEEIESVGAAATFGGGRYNTAFGAKSLAEDLPLLMDVLAESLQRATFPPEEVERLRGQILTALGERANDTGSQASLAFRKLAYPDGHPFGYSIQGYTETIQALTRDDLARFYQQGYGAQGMALCVVGAVHADDALAQIEAAFAGWRGQTLPRAPLPAVSRPEGIIRRRMDMPQKMQTDLLMGLPGPARTEPDYLDAALANTILGVFGLMGRLGKRLRDEQGLAYYVYSQIVGGLGPAPWFIAAGVDPDNVERIIEGVQTEIRCMRATPVDGDELADVHAYLTGSLPLSLETNEGVSGAMLNMEQYQLGFDYLARYPGLIFAITAERIQAALCKWLDPDNMVISIAGPGME
jgi:zinc protease